MNLKKVVVTGIGAITPIGKNIGEFWTGLSNGLSGAAMITRFDTTHFRTKFACEVKDYNPIEFFDRQELYGTPEGDYSDNSSRFVFFSLGILEACKALNFKPNSMKIIR